MNPDQTAPKGVKFVFILLLPLLWSQIVATKIKYTDLFEIY